MGSGSTPLSPVWDTCHPQSSGFSNILIISRPVSREFLGVASSWDLSGGLPHLGGLSLQPSVMISDALFWYLLTYKTATVYLYINKQIFKKKRNRKGKTDWIKVGHFLSWIFLPQLWSVGIIAVCFHPRSVYSSLSGKILIYLFVRLPPLQWERPVILPHPFLFTCPSFAWWIKGLVLWPLVFPSL